MIQNIYMYSHIQMELFCSNTEFEARILAKPRKVRFNTHLEALHKDMYLKFRVYLLIMASHY